MVNLLREMGVPVKNHMSSIDEETVQRIRGKFDQEKEAVKHAEEEKKKKLEEAKRARRVEKAKTKPREGEPQAAAEPAVALEEPAEVDGDEHPGRRRRRRRRRRVDQAAVEANIKKTLAKMEGKSPRRRKRVRKEETDEQVEVAEPENLIRVTEGEARVFGHPHDALAARRLVGLAEQDINLDRFLDVEETLRFHGGYYGMDRAHAKRRDRGVVLPG